MRPRWPRLPRLRLFGFRPWRCERSWSRCDWPDSCDAYGECGFARQRELSRFDHGSAEPMPLDRGFAPRSLLGFSDRLPCPRCCGGGRISDDDCPGVYRECPECQGFG